MERREKREEGKKREWTRKKPEGEKTEKNWDHKTKQRSKVIRKNIGKGREIKKPD